MEIAAVVSWCKDMLVLKRITLVKYGKFISTQFYIAHSGSMPKAVQETYCVQWDYLHASYMAVMLKMPEDVCNCIVIKVLSCGCIYNIYSATS